MRSVISRRSIRQAACAVLIVICAPTVASQEANSEYRADVKRLFSEVLSCEVVHRQLPLLMLGLRAEIQKGNPDIPRRTIEIFASEVEILIDGVLRDPARFSELTSDSLARDFTHDEIKDILSFHLSRAGRKWQKVFCDPGFTERVMSSWFKASISDLCRRVNNRLRQEGLKEMPRNVCSFEASVGKL